MATKSSDAVIFAMPSDKELEATRVFNAPRTLVFEAITRCEHIRNWWGLRTMTMTTCEIDLRPGGRWRYVVKDPNGQDIAFSGVYREIVPPQRLVNTEGWEAMPGHDYVVTTTLTEQNGKTTLHLKLLYKSREDRDGHFQSGAEMGMNVSMERLEELLTSMTATR